MSCLVKCEATTATLLSMSMGSVELLELPLALEPLEVSELGVEAAVVEVDDVLVLGTEVLLDSGRCVDIQGWFRRSRRLGRSLGLNLRHLLIMSWHSWVSRVRNRTSALQMASSFS